jgi:glycosyltransferase involved in cell wall biosynthesis
MIMINNVIVMSYNRPRMVREAIGSVLASKAEIVCWVYDDGSDFDIRSVIEDIGDNRVVLAVADKVTPEERVRPGSTRWSTNMNWLLSKIPDGQTITYLCDDDILHPDWLSYADDMLVKNPNLHVVVGDMYYFYDGEDPFEDGRLGFPIEFEEEDGSLTTWWNLGAFTHRSECFRKCDVKWRKGYKGHPHSWDVGYVTDILKYHVGYVKIPVPAMYRREHPDTLSARAGRIEGGYYVRAAEDLSPDYVRGMMER